MKFPALSSFIERVRTHMKANMPGKLASTQNSPLHAAFDSEPFELLNAFVGDVLKQVRDSNESLSAPALAQKMVEFPRLCLEKFGLGEEVKGSAISNQIQTHLNQFNTGQTIKKDTKKQKQKKYMNNYSVNVNGSPLGPHVFDGNSPIF